MIDWKKIIEKIGWPRMIIGLFLLSTYCIAPFVGIPLFVAFRDTFTRFGMNAILVLSLMPMIEAGAGLNFGMPLGIEAGLLGALISIQLGLEGGIGFFAAILLAIPFAILFGWVYGFILNRVKGGEMMIATYIGFSMVSFMCMMFLLLPFTKADMIWAYGGEGLRTTISVERYWQKILDDLIGIHWELLPVGEILVFAVVAFGMWIFFRTRTGLSMSAVGKNAKFAQATGVDINRIRIQAVIISTVLAAVGIIIYQQSFGFIQLYLAPFYMAFPAIAAILIGGASVNRVTVWHVLIGTFLFQGILTMTPTVVNAVIQTDMSETIRIIVSNGMILYALTRKGGGSHAK
ncbi:ABC transporter permease subunit [Fusobacterium necrophorum]|uniref:Branched-chain amino acid ABC transporter, permease protein n=2 Tax=Fusobacterium necrophorum TaxID=859 RepID=A0AAN3VU10_9FUSO|nr:ABC transporter [Fusobacterium necrophorum]EFS22730.1 branched-chain amino acid ABC transporter, permease protein [Fusobacterium necrophorum D12]EJU15476.1 branched-chain amino acid ABC transporter, permease protein [Fusobacterium necrophorum subsp. funduliforme Fnf 1007]KDE70333.1 ABC transporter [Fusobacterium necrophorum DAB]KYL01327.1 ABC transporter [Fusobacterium necrophorum subsp. funduliforme]KYL02375.1 ABC transporter [Fusobacterium necrophorum subsp. funduliforme]